MVHSLSQRQLNTTDITIQYLRFNLLLQEEGNQTKSLLTFRLYQVSNDKISQQPKSNQSFSHSFTHCACWKLQASKTFALPIYWINSLSTGTTEMKTQVHRETYSLSSLYSILLIS